MFVWLKRPKVSRMKNERRGKCDKCNEFEKHSIFTTIKADNSLVRMIY